MKIFVKIKFVLGGKLQKLQKYIFNILNLIYN